MKKIILKNIIMESAVFVCGAVLMALEISGSRLLAADYGGTVYVWGSIISVMLGGLSLGYYFGGHLADKKPSEDFLAAIIALAGLLVALVPLFYRHGIAFFSGVPTVIAPLVAVTMLFFLPSILLGAVSPFAIKLMAKKLEKIGETSGNLYATSTLGSVLGTLFTTFWLVLWVPLSTIFFGLSACLFMVSLLLARKHRIYIFCAFAIILLFRLFSGGFKAPSGGIDTSLKPNVNTGEHRLGKINGVPQQKISFTAESLYGTVEVRDHSGIRSMYINGGVMGEIFIADKFKTVPAWGYVDCFEALALLDGRQKEVLNLGVGPGLVAGRLAGKDNMKVDAVDINDKVLQAAQEYFGLLPGKNLHLFNEDARMFLKKTGKKYDLIEMDAFKYDRGTYSIPPHLTTQEFFREIKARLREPGTFVMMVVNNDNFLKSEYVTLQSVFKNVYAFDCSFLFVLIASDKPLDVGKILKDSRCTLMPINVLNAAIFTDNFAPVNQLGTAIK
ncbi:MAG: fused MFS/spermidine synthase [Candidatus Omnitrophica bacterium]|nr:fused MFS/spermidine synthase [Candidatus Omnitrophota bacterium]